MMNDTTKTDAPQLPAKRTHTPAPPSAPMPTALALYLDDSLYERVSSVASRMSKAAGVTPKHLIGAPEACFAVVSRAITWRLDPFAVAMATYQTPGGQIGFEGKLVHAIIENSGCLDPAAGGIRYEHYGDWSHVQGRFAIKETQGDGKTKKYAVPTWNDDDARKGKPDDPNYPLAQSCGVRVIAQLRGEPKPRILDFDLIQAQPRNSTLWATDPMTQICYTAVRRFGSVAAPTLLMGVPFDPVDRFTQPGEVDITPPSDIQMPRAKADAYEDLDGVDRETGEIAKAAEPDATKAQEPAESGQPTGDLLGDGTDAAKPAEIAAKATETGPAAGMNKPASDAQRNMIISIAKRAGFNVAQLDERLVEKFSMGIDELPMGLVSEATQLVRALKPATANA